MKFLFLERIGRPDLLWSVNTVSRSPTKRTEASWTKILRLISYINPSKDYRQFCNVGNHIEDCKLGVFQDASFAGDLRDSKINVRRFAVRIRIAHASYFHMDVQEANNSFSQQVSSLKLCRLTKVHAWMFYQLFNFGSACWKRCLAKEPRGTLSVTHVKESFRLAHILTIVLF